MTKFITVHKPYEVAERHTTYTRITIEYSTLSINVNYIMYYEDCKIVLDDDNNTVITVKESEKEIALLIHQAGS